MPMYAGQDDGLLAVVAHALLGSISVVLGAVETLESHWADLDDKTRNELLEHAAVQARYVSESLKDLLRGLPEEVIEALDALRTGDGPHQQRPVD